MLYIIIIHIYYVYGNLVNVTMYYDCSGHHCIQPVPWNESLYVYPMETLPTIVNDTLFVSGAFSDSLDINCFECVSLEIENKTLIVQKTNRCPVWSHGCDNFHIDLNIPGFDNLQFSTANICDSTDSRTSEQSFVYGEWYNHYDTFVTSKRKLSVILPETFQRACQLFL